MEKSTPLSRQVFISHDSQDKSSAELIALKIKEMGFKPWLDKWNLIPGQQWQPKINQALEECDACLVLIGPTGLGPWQHMEMQQAITRQVDTNDNFPVIPVLLPGASRPKPGSQTGFLYTNTWVEFNDLNEDDAEYRYLALGIKGIPMYEEASPKKPFTGNPFVGLHSYEEEHSQFFSGRAGMIDTLLHHIRESLKFPGQARMLAIIGASGTGKSSLARAGLIPALKKGRIKNSDNWPTPIIIRPTEDPLHMLALGIAKIGNNDSSNDEIIRLKETMLRDEKTLFSEIELRMKNTPETFKCIILFDQFEELIQCKSEDVALFIKNLSFACRMPGKFYPVITLRSDFLHRFYNYPAFTAVLADNVVLARPLVLSEWKEILVNPARLAGCSLEPGLSDEILSDILDAKNPSGLLPLVQHILEQLWNEKNKKNQFLKDVYKSKGRLGGALQKWADEAYESFNEEKKQVCRNIFLHLISMSTDTKPIRRRASIEEMYTISTNKSITQEVVKFLAERRLITCDDEKHIGTSSLELSHETILTNWSKFDDWVKNNEAWILIHERMKNDVVQWELNKKDRAYLYTGRRLDQAIEFTEYSDFQIDDLEKEFIEAGKTMRAESELSEKRTRKRLEHLVVGLTISTILLIGMVALTYNYSKESVAKEWAANSQFELSRNVDTSLILSLNAIKKKPCESARIALRNSIIALLESHKRARLIGHTQSIRGVAVSCDGSLIATCGEDNTIRIWSFPTGDSILTIGLADNGHSGFVYSVAFHPYIPTILISASADSTVRLWQLSHDTIGGLHLSRWVLIAKHRNTVRQAVFNDSGTIIATTSKDKTTMLCSLSVDCTVLKTDTLTGQHRGEIYAVAICPGSTYVATAGSDSSICIWANKEFFKRLPYGNDRLRSLDFSPDGKFLIVGGNDSVARIWSIPACVLIDSISVGPGSIYCTRFSPKRNSPRIAVAYNSDDRIRVWDLDSTGIIKRQTLQELIWHTMDPNCIAFSSDGRYIASVDAAAVGRIWEIDAGKRETILSNDTSHTQPVRTIAINLRDTTLRAVGYEDGSVDIKYLESEVDFDSYKHNGYVVDVAFSPDGKYLASAGGDNIVIIRDIHKRMNKLYVKPSDGWLYSIAFSPAPDEHILATAGRNGIVRIWNLDKKTPCIKIPAHTGRALGISFSPDGAHLATVGEDGMLNIWDTKNGSRLDQIKAHCGWIFSVAYNYAGDRIVTAGQDSVVKVWLSTVKLKHFRTLEGHKGQVNHAYFCDATEERVISCGNDGCVLMWELQHGKIQNKLAFNEPIYDCAMDKKTQTLLITDGAKVKCLHNEMCWPYDSLLTLAENVRQTLH